MDRFKGPFRIRVRCKTALSVPNENYQRFPVIPTFFPLPRNEHSLSKSNNITFAPSRLSLDSSTTAHYVVKTHKRDNHVDILSTTEAEDDCDDYDESRTKTTKSSVANTPFFRKFSGQEDELETWDEQEEEEQDFCSSVSRTETKGMTAVTTPTTAFTSVSSTTSHKAGGGINEKYRPRSKYSVSSSFKTNCKSQTSSSKKSVDKNKSRPLAFQSTVDWQSKHPFEGKSLEELEQLLRKYQNQQNQNQDQEEQSKSVQKPESDGDANVQNSPPPDLENLQGFIDVSEQEMANGGDGDNNNSNISSGFQRFPGKNGGKFQMPMCGKVEMNETGDFFPRPNFTKNQMKSWTSLETELIFNGHHHQGSSNPNLSPVLESRKFQFESGPGPFQRQLLDRLQARIPVGAKPIAGIGKPVLSDFSRPKFFQAPLRRLPTSWHIRPGTPLQKIYGSVVKQMPMDTETQRQKLIYQAVDNGHMYRRIKQATSIYKRKEQLMDFKKHEAFIKFRGPVANIQKRAAQKHNSSMSMSSVHQNGDNIEAVDSISISIFDNELDEAHYEDDEFELDSQTEDDTRQEVHVDSSDSKHQPLT